MKMKIVYLVALIFVILFVVPVLFAQISETQSREWELPNLDEMSYSEVTFLNEGQDIQLAGMLFMPEGEGPFPAVVYLYGSGPSSRENRWMLTLVKHLQENGIMVLVPDKRGSSLSEGDWRTASFEDLGRDALAAVQFLKGQNELLITDIGLIGSSQGGHITPLIAGLSSEIDFIVNLSGTAVPIREQLVYEETHNLREMGFLPVVSDALAYPAAWSIREVRQKPLWDAIGDYDPMPYWQKLEVNALVMYGIDDTNIPARKSAALLNSLQKSNITVQLYEGSGHDLESPVGQGNTIIRQEVLDEVRLFILNE